MSGLSVNGRSESTCTPSTCSAAVIKVSEGAQQFDDDVVDRIAVTALDHLQ